MREAFIDEIRVLPYSGIGPNHRGHPRHVAVCSFDVETCDGRPYALGWSGSDGAVELVAVKPKMLLPLVLDRIQHELTRRYHPLVLVWAHFLPFDLGVSVYPWLEKWNRDTAKHGRLTFGESELEYVMGKVAFAHVRFRKSHAMILDTSRYFNMSLEHAAEAAGLLGKKLEHPPGLGQRIIPMDELSPYLTADVTLARGLGLKIVDWHRDLDLYPCVSVAQLSMRTFRRQFVSRRLQSIPGTPGSGVTPASAPVGGVLRASLCAYHAGRNGLYCEPGWYKVKVLDLNSAFPAAMKRLPCFSKGAWRHVSEFSGVWGFYRLYQGTLHQGTYPILFSHDFKPLPDGPLRAPVWVTGHELDAAQRAGLVSDVKCLGYVWRPRAKDRPFRAFVDYYWKERKAARTLEKKTFVKLLMNSLYGKMIARTELDEPEELDGGRIVTQHAGGQFYPAVAAWITAQVRVWLWRMERKSQALHSATDGVMVRPGFRFRSSRRLGAWKQEAEGWALILRNKFYLVFNDKGELTKWAYHGFDGTVLDLVRMLETGEATYPVGRLRGWFESAAAGLRPFANDPRTFSVSCDVRGFWPPPFPVAAVPVRGGWKRLVWSPVDREVREAHALPIG